MPNLLIGCIRCSRVTHWQMADGTTLCPRCKPGHRIDGNTDPALVLALAPLIEQVILDRAANWEHQFKGEVGSVVSVSDAAHVAARWMLEQGYVPA